MTIEQMQCLSKIWLKMSHFIRSVSDHGKYDIKFKVSIMGVHSCVVMVVTVLAIKREPKFNQKQRKMFIFSNFCNIKVRSIPPINTPQGINMVIKNLLALFLIFGVNFLCKKYR